MKRLIPVCTSADEKAVDGKAMYSRGLNLEGFDDDDEGSDEMGHIPEKKRRLSVAQVKALEKSFEMDNKLEPERKVKLAQDLGLLPRQVAVWFQNRRARWKTKQLEKDFRLLKANYDALQTSCNALEHDKEELTAELEQLKAKFKDEVSCGTPATETKEEEASFADCKSIYLKDVDNNSDSSAILDDAGFDPSTIDPSASSSIDCYEFSDTHQFMRMEEHSLLNVDEETCDIFADEQAAGLPWYCTEPWN